MDKSWVHIKDRRLPEYLNGMDAFLNFAFSRPNVADKIACPCRNCNNLLYKTKDDVKGDLLRWGMVPNYTSWILHGESSDVESCDDDSYSENDLNVEQNDDAQTFSMLHDMYQGYHLDEETIDNSSEEPNEEAKRFYRLLWEAEQKLYADCEFSKLSYIVHVFQMKCRYGWSNASCDTLLQFHNKLLPKGNLAPNSMYEAQKIIKDLGLDYTKIDACVNDCVLYRKQYENLDNCPTCGESR